MIGDAVINDNAIFGMIIVFGIIYFMCMFVSEWVADIINTRFKCPKMKKLIKASGLIPGLNLGYFVIVLLMFVYSIFYSIYWIFKKLFTVVPKKIKDYINE